MLQHSFNLLGWNVRGLNDQDRRDTVHETTQIVCLQETKLAVVSPIEAAYIGGYRLKSFAERPAIGTRGGILLLWDESSVQITNVHITEFSLSADVHLPQSSAKGDFKITAVYGPTAANRKDDFFAELVALKPAAGVRWLALGDFNQIRRASDKNKPNIDRSRINRFRDALHDCELSEIRLQNRRFTWTNGRANPTLCNLDAFFCNAEWDLRFDTHVLHALSSSLSDHCPLLLADDSGPRRPRTFKFENFWTRIPRFIDVVKAAWDEPMNHTEPCHVLFHKLSNTAKRLSRWGRGLFSNGKIMLHAALLVILHFDMAQEIRVLSIGERDLHARLKKKVIALAVVERARKKQCARISNIKEGDANTKFFHLRVNARRRKNHIYRLKRDHGWVTDHKEKEEVVHDHFKEVIGKGAPRSNDFMWDELHFENPAMEGLGDPITEEEVLNAINLLPGDKAPGPDGFTGIFFKKCWGIIKHDVMRVILQFSNLQTANFHWLNTANIAMLPKKEGADDISDFRPISLIHAIAKIIAKVLALRLGPLMDELVSNAQSSFIKKRSIHDNFLYVKNLAKRLHKSKTPSLLFKLDIRKAFDSIRWEYILDLLRRRGFPAQFRNWITALLSTASSRVILNGIAGPPIIHGQGLRQGDPLSPLLFVLAIDPLAQILDVATTHGLLHKIRGRGNILRTSLYADDAAIFVAPIKEDIQNLANILHSFGEVTGLATNFLKSSVVPIR
jgi:exonuclease III